MQNQPLIAPIAKAFPKGIVRKFWPHCSRFSHSNRSKKELCFSEIDDVEAMFAMYCPVDDFFCGTLNPFVCLFCQNCALDFKGNCVGSDNFLPPPDSGCNSHTTQSECEYHSDCKWCGEVVFYEKLSSTSCPNNMYISSLYIVIGNIPAPI